MHKAGMCRSFKAKGVKKEKSFLEWQMAEEVKGQYSEK